MDFTYFLLVFAVFRNVIDQRQRPANYCPHSRSTQTILRDLLNQPRPHETMLNMAMRFALNRRAWDLLIYLLPY